MVVPETCCPLFLRILARNQTVLSEASNFVGENWSANLTKLSISAVQWSLPVFCLERPLADNRTFGHLNSEMAQRTHGKQISWKTKNFWASEKVRLCTMSQTYSQPIASRRSVYFSTFAFWAIKVFPNVCAIVLAGVEVWVSPSPGPPSTALHLTRCDVPK